MGLYQSSGAEVAADRFCISRDELEKEGEREAADARPERRRLVYFDRSDRPTATVRWIEAESWANSTEGFCRLAPAPTLNAKSESSSRDAFGFDASSLGPHVHYLVARHVPGKPLR